MTTTKKTSQNLETTKKNSTSKILNKDIEKKQSFVELTQNQEGKIDYALGKENYILLIIGFAIIILGFILMTGGASTDPNVFDESEIFSFRRITLAPIVVLFGFVFEIWAIMKKSSDVESN